MLKKIELIPVIDPQSLKEVLEEKINDGWEIRGFVSFNCGSPGCESYAVLEGLTEGETVKEAEYETEGLPEPDSPYPKSPKKKEVSISMGGN